MKKLICALLISASLFCFSGCNRQIIDTTYNYTKAIVSLPDGTLVSGKVDSWRDYD